MALDETWCWPAGAVSCPGEVRHDTANASRPRQDEGQDRGGEHGGDGRPGSPPSAAPAAGSRRPPGRRPQVGGDCSKKFLQQTGGDRQGFYVDEVGGPPPPRDQRPDAVQRPDARAAQEQADTTWRAPGRIRRADEPQDRDGPPGSAAGPGRSPTMDTTMTVTHGGGTATPMMLLTSGRPDTSLGETRLCSGRRDRCEGDDAVGTPHYPRDTWLLDSSRVTQDPVEPENTLIRTTWRQRCRTGFPATTSCGRPGPGGRGGRTATGTTCLVMTAYPSGGRRRTT